MDDILYFISHSASDKKLAAVFYEYYTEALGIPKEKVFCASISRQIPIGMNYLEFIKESLLNTKKGTIIALITDNFLRSDFCKYEIGAAWGLDIPVYPILFPPVDYNDAQIKGSPLTLTQSLKIEKKDMENTTENIFMSLFDIAKSTKESDIYIQSVTESNRWRKNRNLVTDIMNYIQSVEKTRVEFDILGHRCFVYHENGNAQTLTNYNDYDDNILNLKFDFVVSEPEFVGYAIKPISPKNWVPYVENNYYIRFDAFATDTDVDSIFVEINGMNYRLADRECKLKSGHWTTFSLYLGRFDSEEDEWCKIKEICLVIKSSCITSKKGDIQVRNMRLEKDPIN